MGAIPIVKRIGLVGQRAVHPVRYAPLGGTTITRFGANRDRSVKLDISPFAMRGVADKIREEHNRAKDSRAKATTPTDQKGE